MVAFFNLEMLGNIKKEYLVDSIAVEENPIKKDL